MTIKPNKQKHINVMIFFCVWSIVLFVIFDIIYYTTFDEFLLSLYVLFSVIGFYIIMFIFARLLIKDKYVFSDTEMIKFIGKTPVYKIGYKDITGLYYSKTPWWDWFYIAHIFTNLYNKEATDYLIINFTKVDVVSDKISGADSSGLKSKQVLIKFDKRDIRRICTLIDLPLKTVF